MSAGIQTKWNRYVDWAISHEEEHGDIIKKHATNSYNEVLRLKGKCKDMGSLVDKIIKKASRKMMSAHKRLDARSGHMKNVSVTD